MSPNGLLLYVPGSNGVDFIKMEIIDLKVKMEWNLGSGIGVIQTQDIFSIFMGSTRVKFVILE